jgi:hypothetical protein
LYKVKKVFSKWQLPGKTDTARLFHRLSDLFNRKLAEAAPGFAQDRAKVDSLKHLLQSSQDDTAKVKHESPVFMLLIMVALAAVLVPLHHRLEHWITHKLVEKNVRIRLAAAKRTIQQLEGSPGVVVSSDGSDAKQEH